MAAKIFLANGKSAGMRLILLFSLAMWMQFVLPVPAIARVSGPCANCHTMHNTDGNGAVYDPDGPYGALTKGDCVGCHSAEGNVTISSLGVPIVNTTGEPAYGYPPYDSSSAALAGGNFYWVINKGDAYGHNCLSVDGIEQDGALTDAPGRHDIASGTACARCHKRIDGCDSCHTPAHHADDSGPVVDGAGGWYRFLNPSPEFHDTGLGVMGIEDADWEQSVSATDHNEYMGVGEDLYGAEDNSMSDYCAGCHEKFHGIQNIDVDHDPFPDNQSPWYMHPTHLPLPVDEDKDYHLYNTPDGANIGPYNPESPVARDPNDLAGMTGPSNSVAPGQDQVFCLSCHRVHGSPYADILRWDYEKMIAGNPATEDKGHGCFVCHVTKDE